MAIFNSYVSLPEGTVIGRYDGIVHSGRDGPLRPCLEDIGSISHPFSVGGSVDVGDGKIS